VTTEALYESLLRLRARCRRVALISLAQEPPRVVPGIETTHRPFHFEAPAR
jgi:hypothetical protein